MKSDLNLQNLAYILYISYILYILYVLSLILFEILFPLFAAADYLNMTVSNKKALATLWTLYSNELNVF